ncbi:MAG: hypothetical protein IPF42_05350 [Candidatus Microthrix sp.]|jgi:4-amino-4-deoxy-L-arabinose transferase-like glycosyltransferase|nr:hypothetical protein [Candidatus Microthrix sp.]
MSARSRLGSGERSARTPLPARALWWILAIWLASLGFRVVYLTVINPDQPLTGDGLYYHLLGNRLADGDGFSSPTGLGVAEEIADHPPGYPAMLSLASRVGLDSRDEHRLVSALVGSLAIPFLGLAGGRLAAARRRGPPPAPRVVAWAAIAAASLAALDVNMWVWDPLILAEPLVLAAVAAWLYGALAYDDDPSWGSALGLGLAFGIAAATRSELLVAVLVIPVLLYRRRRQLTWGRFVVHGAAMAAGLVLFLGPWVWSNLHRFEEPVVMTTGLGTTMVQGNCTPGFYGPYTGYSDFACFDRTRSVVTPEMDASQRDVLGREIATDYIGRNLGRLPVVAVARVARTFGFFRPVQQSGIIEGVELRGPHWVVWGGLISWQLLLPLGVAGVVLARREGRLIAPVVAVTGAVVFAVALTQGADRYRMALEPLLIAYAGFAIALSLAVVGRSTPALADTGPGRWLRKWSPRPEAQVSESQPPGDPSPGADDQSSERTAVASSPSATSRS